MQDDTILLQWTYTHIYTYQHSLVSHTDRLYNQFILIILLIEYIKQKPCVVYKTYIITGGLGGLGRELAVWMASQGAKHIVLMTRSTASAVKSKGLLETLQAYGYKGNVTVYNITDQADVTRVISSIDTPIGGVVHSALNLSVKQPISCSTTDIISDSLI